MSPDGFFAKYGPSGEQKWGRTVDGFISQTTQEIGIDASGHIYLGASASGELNGQGYAGGSADAAVVKFEPDGTRQWTRLFGSSGKDQPKDILAGSDDRVALTGVVSRSLDGESHAGAQDGFIKLLDRGGFGLSPLGILTVDPASFTVTG